MPYRAMALVAASFLFATQCNAGTTLNSNKSNNFKQTKQTGGTKPAEAANFNTGKSNTYRMGGGGGGKGATGPANATTVHGSRANHDLRN